MLPTLIRRFVDRVLGGSTAPLAAYLAEAEAGKLDCQGSEARKRLCARSRSRPDGLKGGTLRMATIADSLNPVAAAWAGLTAGGRLADHPAGHPDRARRIATSEAPHRRSLLVVADPDIQAVDRLLLDDRDSVAAVAPARHSEPTLNSSRGGECPGRWDRPRAQPLRPRPPCKGEPSADLRHFPMRPA